MPTRPSLYSSPIQHVLVLQEDDTTTTTTTTAQKPWPDVHPTLPKREEIPYLWRVRDRLKTAHGALVLCLNIGFDPSDVTKPSPCAKLQCWIDPNADTPVKSLQHIANALKAQYETWQPKTRYKLAPDPTATELKRVCVNLRRAAKDERVLFHYNGYGVPKPTDAGEIWVFDHHYTHYIPFNLHDLNQVLGNPSLYIFDCNSAGTIFQHFKRLNNQFENKWEEACQNEGKQLPPPPHRNSIFLGACAAGELLPTTPSVPADLFTSCLTTPLKTALHWFVKRTLVMGITTNMLDRIPGNLNSRNTPLGELNWIFTAVTDTIAWNVLPREMFKKLYRQDMLLASLMRNFLLADRIMRSFGCHPVSHPPLPETHTHPLWESFELSMEQLLAQLPMMIAEEEAQLRRQEEQAELRAQSLKHHVRFAANGEDPRHTNIAYNGRSPTLQSDTDSKVRYRYRPCTFFEDQMRAFDLWLDMGPDQRNGPEQLPIMLQVLLSPTLRIKALPMISRYLQTGPLAVDQALAVGIFPYVLRLLRSQSPQMRQDLVFIWSKILALDDSCRSDLVKDKGEEYFVRFLMPGRGDEEDPKPVYLAVAMFVLSVLAKDYADRCRAVGTLEACYSRLSHESPFVRRWACLCLTEVIKRAPPPSQSQALAWVDLVQTLRHRATNDEASDVRAAAVSTLSAIMNGILNNISEERSASSTDLRSDFQTGSESSEPGNMTSERDTLATDRDAPNVLGSQDTKFGANGKPPIDELFIDHEKDFLDMPVPPFMPVERDALLSLGTVIAEVARWESSVLVRREVAIAIASAVKYREHRFIRAAYVTDVMGLDEEEESITSTDIDKCEAVYRKLWNCLSELAYDPHPIIAALARRSFDLISEKLLEQAGPAEPLPSDEIASEGKKLSQPRQIPNKKFLSEFSIMRPEIFEKAGPSSSTARKGESSHDWSRLRRAGQEKSSKELVPNSYPPPVQARGNKAGDSRESPLSAALSPPKLDSLKTPAGKNLMMERRRKKLAPGLASPGLPREHEVKTVHVRSSSGSFNLDVPSRLPRRYERIPRVNSASLIRLEKNVADSSEFGHTPPQRAKSNLTGSFDFANLPREEERQRSLGQSALAKGVGNLVRTVSQQFNLTGLTGSPAKDRPIRGQEQTRENQEEKGQHAISPPRPPKRSVSYQVLNAATSLSPQTKTPVFGMSRHTSYVKSKIPRDQSFSTRNEKVPSVFDRLYLSGAGDAALSLYEWSSAHISKVETTATSDAIHEEESIPRYAALWHKFTTSGGDIPVVDNLLSFARLGESDSLRLGPIVNASEEGNDFNNARQLSLYLMGAGGGSITAMAFLPRDIGMADDQLLATGDSTGSVGVYDIRTGKCQGYFGVPTPPGIPEAGVSSVLCLNTPSPSTKEDDDGQPYSGSALILAGAYDGRVAVFKSDFQTSKYRIMSTFQASGQSFWSKAGTNGGWRRNGQSSSPSPGDQKSSAVQNSSPTATEGPLSFAQVVRDSGNGLALAFDANTSYLAAGGCDKEIVRVWDLRREQCVWEGATVKKGTWPTALCMWNRVNPNLFVVGSSSGDVNVIDMREPPIRRNETRDFRRLGSHSQPIISVGTCPRGKNGEGEAVVAADIGGEMAFWEPRWNGRGRCSANTEQNDETTRIKAHTSNVAAMAVHPSGRYVASGSTFGTTGKCVKIFGPNRRMVKKISHYERPGGGLLPYNNRIPPVTSLTFEHETSLLAIGFIDSSVMIYGRPEHFSGV